MKSNNWGITVFIALLLTGCASTKWYNSNLRNPEQRERQLTIDNGYCKQVAHGAAPMPDIRLYDSSANQSGYYVAGDITTVGKNGTQTSSYRGTVTPIPNYAQSFNQGVSQGLALGTAMRANKVRDEIYKGCMFKLGWSDSLEQNFEELPPDAPSPLIQQQAKQQNISCDQWSTDIAVSVDSAYKNGIDKKIVHSISKEYLNEMSAPGRDTLIFMHLINVRYRVPLNELSSEDFPRYVRWECEKNWAGIGLSNS